MNCDKLNTVLYSSSYSAPTALGIRQEVEQIGDNVFFWNFFYICGPHGCLYSVTLPAVQTSYGRVKLTRRIIDLSPARRGIVFDRVTLPEGCRHVTDWTRQQAYRHKQSLPADSGHCRATVKANAQLSTKTVGLSKETNRKKYY